MGTGVSSQRAPGWRLVDGVLHLLDAEERDAVRGDLAESCESAAQALRGVLRLVIHRQSTLWQHSRPWFVLFLFVMPLGVLLSFASCSHVGLSSIYLWLVINNVNLSLLHNTGYWYTLLQILPTLVLPCIMLGCIAWTAGVLLAGIARRTLWTNGVVLCLVLLCANAFTLPQPQHVLAFDVNAPVHEDVSTGAFFRCSSSVSAFCCLRSWAWGRPGTQASSRRRFDCSSGPPCSFADFQCWPPALHSGCCASGLCRRLLLPDLQA